MVYCTKELLKTFLEAHPLWQNRTHAFDTFTSFVLQVNLLNFWFPISNADPDVTFIVTFEQVNICTPENMPKTLRELTLININEKEDYILHVSVTVAMYMIRTDQVHLLPNPVNADMPGVTLQWGDIHPVCAVKEATLVTRYPDFVLFDLPLCVGSSRCSIAFHDGESDVAGYYVVNGQCRIMQHISREISSAVIRTEPHCRTVSIRMYLNKYLCLTRHNHHCKVEVTVTLPFAEKCPISVQKVLVLMGVENVEDFFTLQEQSLLGFQPTLVSIKQLQVELYEMFDYTGEDLDKDKCERIRFLFQCDLFRSLVYPWKQLYFIHLVHLLLRSTGDHDRLAIDYYYIQEDLALLTNRLKSTLKHIELTFPKKLMPAIEKCKKTSSAPMECGSELFGSIVQLLGGSRQSFQIAIRTGDWNKGINHFYQSRAGTTQLLERTNVHMTIQQLCRVKSSYKGGNILGCRRRLVHPSQIFTRCTAYTSNGEDCGLISALSLHTQYTQQIPRDTCMSFLHWFASLTIVNLFCSFDTSHRILCRDILRHGSLYSCDDISPKLPIWIFIGCVPIGYTEKRHVMQLYRHCCQWRQCNFAHSGVCWINFNANLPDETGCCRFEIRFSPGRTSVPLITLPLPHEIQQPTWGELLEKNLIVYLDDCEIYSHCKLADTYENCVIGQHTHLLLDPATVFSYLATRTSFFSNGYAIRSSLAMQHSHHAIGGGLFHLYDQVRFDTHQLVYPQKALCSTKISTIMNEKWGFLPCIQNLVTGIITDAVAVEDALVVNKASVERGMCMTLEQKVYTIPCATPMRRPANVTYLDESGVPIKGKILPPHAIIFGSIPPVFGPSYVRSRVIDVRIHCGDHIAKVQYLHQLTEGDKLASSHGQKGVVGQLRSPEDMPFCESEEFGTFDLLMAPSMFSSRMTMGDILEMFYSREALEKAEFYDGSPFMKSSIQYEALYDALQSTERRVTWDGTLDPDPDINFKKNIAQKFKTYAIRSGITGNPLPRVSIGLLSVQTLGQRAAKLYACNQAPRNALTKQPKKGRQCQGGLRLGEMEVNTLAGHGAKSILHEMLFTYSDNYTFGVCPKTGIMQGCVECICCTPAQVVYMTDWPYTASVMLRELMMMGIEVKLQLQKRKEPLDLPNSTSYLLATKSSNRLFLNETQLESIATMPREEGYSALEGFIAPPRNPYEELVMKQVFPTPTSPHDSSPPPVSPRYCSPPPSPRYSSPPPSPRYSSPPLSPRYSSPPVSPRYCSPPVSPRYSSPPASPRYSSPAVSPLVSNDTVSLSICNRQDCGSPMSIDIGCSSTHAFMRPQSVSDLSASLAKISTDVTP